MEIAIFDQFILTRNKSEHFINVDNYLNLHNITYLLMYSGGSSIEADKALPHPQSPRSNTLQYVYLQYSKMRCIVKGNIFLNLKTFFGFEILSFRPLFNPLKNNNLG